MEENLLQARRLVLIQYACRISPRSPAFQWPDAVLLLQIQPFIDGDLQPDRAQTAYEKKFLKELNSKLEDSILATGMDSDEEVDPALLERYVELMAPSSGSKDEAADSWDRFYSSVPFHNHAPPAEQHLSYYFPYKETHAHSKSIRKGWTKIRLREASSSLVSSGSTACKTWEASLRLASHLLDEEERAKLRQPGAKVLELGSGNGLVSTLVALLQLENSSLVQSSSADVSSDVGESGPWVYATDLPSVTQTRLRSTFVLNSETLRGASNLLGYDVDWIDVDRRLKEGDEVVQPLHLAPSLILGADIVFDPDIYPALVTAISYALRAGARRITREGHEGGPEAIISSTVRNATTYSRFLACLDEAGLHSEELNLQRAVSGHVDGFQGILKIMPFPSAHNEATEGVVSGLRICLPPAP